MPPLFNIYLSFISGAMVGFEFEEDEEYNYIIVDLFIVQVIVEWAKK